MANLASAISLMGPQTVGAVATQVLLRAFDAHAASLPPHFKAQVGSAASTLILLLLPTC
jgi:hypothetical protein